MNVKYEFADQHDIEKITDLRMQYLLEAYGGIKQDELRIIRENNLRYLKKYLNEKCFVAYAENEKVCSCVYMNIIEKAPNLRFMNGYYGEVYGVFTFPKYRKMGIATELVKMIIKKGRDLKVPFIQLEASEEGYSIYKKIGFEEVNSRYVGMKYYIK